MFEQKKRVIYVYSVGARFVGSEATGKTVKKFEERTLCVFIDARKVPDPADKPSFPKLPGYDPEVRNQILDLLPEEWLEDVWNKEVLSELEHFLAHSELYDYMQIMVMCGAGYQRSPAIVSRLVEALGTVAMPENVLLVEAHFSAKLAHQIKTETGLR